MTRRDLIRAALALAAAVAVGLPAASRAQPAPAPHRLEPYTLHSGFHDGRPRTSKRRPAGDTYTTAVNSAGAPWLRLHFADWRLGPGTTLVLTSREDGAQQVLDADGLERWGGASAYFNGDTVDVELRVAPGDRKSFFEIGDLVIGEWAGDIVREVATKSICGFSDNRVRSNDLAIGRIVPVGCTGWATSNGAFLSAGHCVAGNNFFFFDTIEFNVPSSLADGTIRHPPPADQYPIDLSSLASASGGRGNDWAVYAVLENPQTGLTPVEAYGTFFRLSRDTQPPTIRITGYGVDGPAPAYGSDADDERNADSQTQQTSVDDFEVEHISGPTVIWLGYDTDTQGGNSGGPAIALDSPAMAIGIHTHSGCSPFGGDNYATGFKHTLLASAIQGFPGPNVVYVDFGHPVTQESGTVMRPYDRVEEGVAAVPNGGMVSIVHGFYDVQNLTISRPMTLTAPVGLVVIH